MESIRSVQNAAQMAELIKMSESIDLEAAMVEIKTEMAQKVEEQNAEITEFIIDIYI